MNMKRIFIVLSLVLATLTGQAQQAQPAAPSNQAQVELKALITKIQTKLQQGQRSEKELAPELKAFDELSAKHKTDFPEEASASLFMKAMLYVQVFEDAETGVKILAQVQKEYPKTKIAAQVPQVLASIEKMAEKMKLQSALKPGAKFPDFNEKDINGKPLSIASYKGKVVLLDFWATWCGPCVGELPNVKKTYAKYHKDGFEIIGISLDEDKAALTGFLKKNAVTWVQYFDGKGWENKLAQTYGVNSIPATYLLDKNGNIIAKGLRGEALEAAVGKALGK